MKQTAALATMLALGLLVALTGCESMFSDDSPSLDRETMLADYDGFDTSDEMPAFGCPDLAANYADQGEYQDEIENHWRVRNAYRNCVKQYMLRIVWGNIQRPDTTGGMEEPNCPVTDWSGLLEVSGGVVTVKRLIRFEQPADYIIRPRLGPEQVTWVSHTMSDLDGILFKVIDALELEDREVTNSVTITTPFHTVEIPFADLADYREFIEIDECNRLSIVATEVEYMGCPVGFLEGGWVAETDTSGYFRGGWMSSDGSLAGYLRGRCTVRDGRRVLRGKWITLSGEFGGLIAGTWRPADDDRCPDGYFEARWVDDLFIHRGVLRGHYHLGPRGEAGFFHGRWRKFCR